MAARTRKVVFGRINRRDAAQATLTDRTFAQEVEALAESRLTTFTERATDVRPVRTWTAADMEVTPNGDFLTGVLGYSEQQQHVSFDSDSFSWMKGQVEDSDAANEQTIAPFAIDLREHNRWVAVATTPRLQPQAFRLGLELVLNEAVTVLGQLPGAWEVDLVTSRALIADWVRENPMVHFIQRTVKFTNPGRDLDDDRAEMRALAANRKTEEFKASRSRTLDTNSPEFQSKLDGTETGDLEIIMKARGTHNVRDVTFNSRTSVDRSAVEEFGSNLQLGVDVVLAALREYVDSKQGPAQGKLLD